MIPNNSKYNYKYQVIILIFLFMAFFPLVKSVSAMSIVVNIPEKYSDVKVGEKLYFETEVKWPENVGRKDLRVEYSIKDQNGKEVAYLKVLKAIETQASFMDTISISENTIPGTYRLYAKFSDYGGLSQEVTTSFNVTKSDVKSSTYNNIIIGLIALISILIISNIYALAKRSPKPKLLSEI